MSITALRAAASWIGNWPKDKDGDEALTPLAKVVLFTLADRHNQDTGRLDPSLECLACDCGCSIRAVRYAIRQLEQARIIRTTERRRRRGKVLHHLPNSYQIMAFTPGKNCRPPRQELPTNLGTVAPGPAAPSPAVWDDIVMLVEDDHEGFDQGGDSSLAGNPRLPPPLDRTF